MPMKLLVSLLLAVSSSAYADSIYLCRAYSGGMFWAAAHCNQHNALIDRIATVPDNLPWDQKVALGEQSLRGSAPQPAPNTQIQINEQPNRKAECAALDARVTELDAMARQPLPASTQDWIRSQRKTARDRQFQIRC